jgi:hypothetical protein
VRACSTSGGRKGKIPCTELTGDLAAFVSSFLPKEYQKTRDNNYLKCTATPGTTDLWGKKSNDPFAHQKKPNDLHCRIAAWHHPTEVVK